MSEIRIQVAAVLELYDRLTGAPIKKGDLFVDIPSYQKIIKKDEYCYVFLKPLASNLRVIIRSKIYKDMEVELKEKETVDHRILWLEPDKNYIYPYGTTLVEGCIKAAKKQELIDVVPGHEARSIRLTKDYKKGDSKISIYGISEKTQGRAFALWKEDKLVSNVFHIVGEGDTEGSFFLEEPFNEDYRKGEIQIRNVYETRLDESKHFHISMKNIDIDTQAVIFVNGKVKKTVDILAGKLNALDSI